MKYLLLLLLFPLWIHAQNEDIIDETITTVEEDTVIDNEYAYEEISDINITESVTEEITEDSYPEYISQPIVTPPVPTNTSNQIATTSKQIPILNSGKDLISLLNNTVWMASDLKRNEDLFVFFKNSLQGVSLTQRGQKIIIPKKMYPMKIIEDNKVDNSAILLIASEKELLYYSFKLITPFYLAISPGYDDINKLKNLSYNDYFNKGYILQLIY